MVLFMHLCKKEKNEVKVGDVLGFLVSNAIFIVFCTSLNFFFFFHFFYLSFIFRSKRRTKTGIKRYLHISPYGH